MRKTLFLLLVVASLALVVPAQAQLRGDVVADRAPSQLYDSGAKSFLLNKLFNPANFRMSHAVEFSAGSFGGASSSLGMYTNTMAWQFGEKFAARADVSVAYSPFQSGALGSGESKPRVFLRNAEIAYRPAKNVMINLQVRQSPYGSYMSPYGYGPGYGYGHRSSFMPGMYGHTNDLFWQDR